MSDAIWKYELKAMDNVVLMLRGARVLTAQMQGGNPCLWAVVDTSLRPDDTDVRRFVVQPTGAAIPDDLTFTYIATVQEGPFVWHVCEATEPLAGIAGEQ